MDALFDTIHDFVHNKKALAICFLVMINPLLWNIVCRLEYRTHAISNVLGGPKRGCTALAVCILSLNCLRTSLFHVAVDEYGVWRPLDNGLMHALGYLIVGVGALLVISSAWRLGFFVSFMGDYFGIMCQNKVTGFPFNVVSDPMYVGSALVYLGLALRHASVVGLVLTTCIAVSYAVAIRFEGPFTSKIYEVEAKKRAKVQ